MTQRIKLVQGDTRPRLVFSVMNLSAKTPIDISNAGTSVVLKFRMVGSLLIKASLPCTKLTGLAQADGTVLTTAPYNVAGVGGRVYVDWTSTALDTEGDFEGEVEITFSDGTNQTVYDLLKFKVRKQF